MTDPIADMLTRIRNANSSKHKTVDVPSSNMKLAIAEILFKEGYIKSFEEIKEENKLKRIGYMQGLGEWILYLDYKDGTKDEIVLKELNKNDKKNVKENIIPGFM